MKPLNRREVLRGMLGGAAVSVGLPPLEAIFNCSGTAYAAGGGLPTRFGLFFGEMETSLSGGPQAEPVQTGP
jgi:hypothetical protein